MITKFKSRRFRIRKIKDRSVKHRKISDIIDDTEHVILYDTIHGKSDYFAPIYISAHRSIEYSTISISSDRFVSFNELKVGTYIKLNNDLMYHVL